jgi:RimJ/RimL family protein N-acetyltransferase
MIVQVRAMNERARAFYQQVGFVECGRLAKQVRIAGVEDDEILMELFL